MSYVSSYLAGTYAPASCFSADGRFVAFSSWGSNLVPGQLNGSFLAVFVTDLVTGLTTIVSHASPSPTTTANGPSAVPAISADGRWIGYFSSATDLVPGTTSGNGEGNVFLYDRLTGANTLVSHRQGNPLTGGNGGSFAVSVSTDGQVIAFLSRATNLVPSQLLAHDPSGTDVFLFDRISGETTLVSHAAASASRTGNGFSYQYAASNDGRYVAFSSFASDLVPRQINSLGTSNVLLFDRVANTTSLVSGAAGSAVQSGNGASNSPSISADGRLVVYTSYANDFVPGMIDANGGFADVFLFDRLSNATTLVSHSPASPNTTADAGAFQPQISADGTAVVYTSLATELVMGETDPNGQNYDVFVFDRASGVNALVSRSALAASQAGNAESLNPVISADGNRIAFESHATDLVPGQIGASTVRNVFVFDRFSKVTVLASRDLSAPNAIGNADSSGPLLNSDGNLVAFNSDATNLVSSDTNGSLDSFLFRAVSFGSAGSFFPLTPCRLVDTRSGPAGGTAIAALSMRDFTLTDVCGVPSDAASVSFNVTVTQPASAGFVDVLPAGLATPPTAILSFRIGQTRANNAIVSLGGTPSGTASVRNASAGSVHVILDVNGYFR
jgi:Tol biopolymer transport system component